MSVRVSKNLYVWIPAALPLASERGYLLGADTECIGVFVRPHTPHSSLLTLHALLYEVFFFLILKVGVMDIWGGCFRTQKREAGNGR